MSPTQALEPCCGSGADSVRSPYSDTLEVCLHRYRRQGQQKAGGLGKLGEGSLRARTATSKQVEQPAANRKGGKQKIRKRATGFALLARDLI